MENNIINEFVAEIMVDAGVDGSDRELSRELHRALEERVNTRLLLELIARLTPEEAKKLRAELDAKTPNPEKYFGLLADSGHLTPQILMEMLARLRRELLTEFKEAGIVPE